MKISIKKRELKAYLLVTVLSVVMLALSVVFSGKIKAKIFNATSKVTEKASFEIGSVAAAVSAANYSEDEIKTQMEDNKKEVEKVLKENNITPVKDLTPEQEQLIMTGKISAEDAEKLLSSEVAYEEEKPEEKAVSESNVESSDNLTEENKAVSEGAEKDNNANGYVDKKINELYTVKAKYLGLLGSMFSQAEQTYKAMGAHKTPETIAAIKGYISQAGELEKQCDSKVYALLDEIEDRLRQEGGDVSVADAIRQAYVKEKTLKKSYYLTYYDF